MATELLAYARRPHALRPDNRLELLRDGSETFPRMLAAIAEARRSVHMEIYILRSDRTGWRFAEALMERARAGVAVTLLYDSIGSLALDDDYLAALRGAGVEALEFHPVAPWRQRFGLAWITRRNHRKVLIVDAMRAFAGGLNIGDEYESVENGGGGWHDFHVEVEGPVVADLARLLERTWVRAGGRPYPAPESSSPPVASGPSTAGVSVPADSSNRALAMILDNKLRHSRLGIRRAYLHAIQTATQSIAIMNAYFLPDRGVRNALRKAARRGVAVQILLPGVSDIPAIAYAGRHLYARFLKDGVRIFEWPDRMLHAKTAVIDRVWSAIGSYNLDNQSLIYNLEVIVSVLDPKLGEHMHEEFERDAAKSREIVLDAWRRRGWRRRLLEWAFFQLRRWL